MAPATCWVALGRVTDRIEPATFGATIRQDHSRRMSKDYERLIEISEAFIYVAMRRLMVKRLARS